MAQRDPIRQVIELDAARHARWGRLRDALAAERDRRIDELLRFDRPHDELAGLAGEVRGIDLLLRHLSKDRLTDA